MVGVEREVIADVFETMQVLETECGDEGQFHVKDTVLVIGSEDKIGVGETDSLFHIEDWRLEIGDF